MNFFKMMFLAITILVVVVACGSGGGHYVYVPPTKTELFINALNDSSYLDTEDGSWSHVKNYTVEDSYEGTDTYDWFVVERCHYSDLIDAIINNWHCHLYAYDIGGFEDGMDMVDYWNDYTLDFDRVEIDTEYYSDVYHEQVYIGDLYDVDGVLVDNDVMFKPGQANPKVRVNEINDRFKTTPPIITALHFVKKNKLSDSSKLIVSLARELNNYYVAKKEGAEYDVFADIITEAGVELNAFAEAVATMNLEHPAITTLIKYYEIKEGKIDFLINFLMKNSGVAYQQQSV